MYDIYEKQDNKINLYSIFNNQYIKRNDILYLSWNLIMVFIITIIVIHSTIYNSLIISTISILFLALFLFFNYKNLKI